MPILNLENPKFVSVDKAGRPNSNGTIGVYVADGLFTTLATVYSDQVKTAELTNPVTLDQDGTKEIWYDVKVDIRERTSDGVLIGDTLNLDPNASQASVQSFNLAQNGSFEIDSTSDGQPDNWTISPYTGSAIAITEDIVTDGTKALEFNTTGVGSGGGTATSAKFPVTEGSIASVAFSFYATNATTLNTFVIKWYDEDNAASGTPSTTVTMPASGSVPTSWTSYHEEIAVPADATQGEIVLTGIASGGSNLTSKAYFDGIRITNDELVNRTLELPTIKDSEKDNILEFAETATAVNWVKITNAATGNSPVIESTGETNNNIDIDGAGTGYVRTNGQRVYGMVILDEAEILSSSPTFGAWTSSSGFASTTLSTAGAVAAIIRLEYTLTFTGTANIASASLRKAGESTSHSGVIIASGSGQLGASGSIAIDVAGEGTVKLDASSDFEYFFNQTSGTGSSGTVTLVGYYV